MFYFLSYMMGKISKNVDNSAGEMEKYDGISVIFFLMFDWDGG